MGVDKIDETGFGFITRTICHNGLSTDASMKLYYYEDSKMFHCYTECNENFDIFELVQRVIDISFIESIYYVSDITNLSLKHQIEDEKYESISHKYTSKTMVVLKEYNDIVLGLFRPIRLKIWEDEGITYSTLRKFNISFYDYQNKIIIPHHDINHRLIGIRARALEKDQIEQYGKYMPITIEGITYKHPLSLNLYGLAQNKKMIQQLKTVIIFEGERINRPYLFFH